MKQTIIPIKPDAKVTVKCGEDLSVEGTDSATLIVIADQGDSLRMKEENGKISVFSGSDCRLILPVDVTVTVERTGGDCHLSHLNCRVLVGKINGSLKMENIGGASVESVSDECWIHEASGEIEIARIGDSLTADGVQAILASSVGSEVRIKNFHGKVDVNAGDSVSLQCTEPNIPEIHAKAGSDVEIFLPLNANCQLEMVSGGEEIQVHAGGQDAELEDHEFSVLLGEGGAVVQIFAGDSIRVTDQETPNWEDNDDWDHDRWEDFGFDIAEKVKEGLRSAGDSIEDALQKAGLASRQAGRQVNRVMSELEERGINVGRPRKVVGFAMDANKAQTASTKSGPSDEERMLVLRMLQEKKISVEEAEKLLNALER